MRLQPNLASFMAVVAFVGAWILAGARLAAEAAAAPPRSADEYALKSAFLYQLAMFIDWPQGKLKRDNAPLVLGVTGEEGCDRIKTFFADKCIDKHKVVVRLLEAEEEIKDCHILFITRAQKQRAHELVAAANKAAVLTVGETDKFLDSGGMIRFYIESDRVRLEIKEAAMRQAGLSIKAIALSALINRGVIKFRKD